ncbi:YbhB/YbcL family Raf kinase inhibitor-like protein [Variovorax sp. dw_308]|uniref:YbhB/YbcL family Raf kinase inhibitor-like protein n=1 Tax=Variovorax sp. dw_308 TaxID=2721546 RepID=UPI001C4901B2|nr:YbhB/YbcL family Raf kinase inhibitor-like protein [Variovorax sp. dw_308]
MNPLVLRWIGLPLRGRRAGDATLACNDPALASLPDTLALRSDSFTHNGALDLRQAGEGVGGNLSPELHWNPLPPSATNWALIVEDPDVPLRHAYLHGIATGPASVRRMAEGAMPGYAGARPLPGHGTHRYVFQLFALTRAPGTAATREELMPLLRGNAIACSRLVGLFERDWLRARPVPPSPSHSHETETTR